MWMKKTLSSIHNINTIIVASVQVSGTQANKIEGSTIDKQRQVVELVTNKRIEEMIHNAKQEKNVTKYVVPDPPDRLEEFNQQCIFI